MRLIAQWIRRHFRLFLGATLSLAIVLAYANFILPWHLRWGAAQQELDSVMPGDYLVPRAKTASTRAILIRRPPQEIFPWLVQIGQNRGGFYSYEWLENLIGCQIHNADRIHPEWQNLKVGDPIALHPRAPDAYRVEAVEKDRYLLLRAGPGDKPALSTWLFYLLPVDQTSTRLIVRGRGTYAASPVSFFLWRALVEPAHFVMERRMLIGIRDRVESVPAASP